MRNFIIILVSLIVIGTTRILQANDLIISFDAASFYFNDNFCKWELYCSATDDIFTYVPSELNPKYLIGTINAKIYITTNDRIVEEEDWKIANLIKADIGLQQQYIFGVKSFYLQPGQYTVKIIAKDKNDTTRELNISKELIIPKFDKNRINHSEIEFASYIEKIEKSKFELDPMYMKYDYYVIPNPRSEVIGEGSRLLGAMEIYNADKFAKDGFIRSYKLLDNTGSIIEYRSDTCLVNSDNILTLFDIPLDSLYSGVYFFAITSSYPLDNPVDSITSSKKLYYYNPNKIAQTKRYFTENEVFERSEFNSMNEEQTILELEQALVIASRDEIVQAKSLTDLKAKQRFLFKFWFTRDTDTLYTWNEKLRVYRENISFANRFFSFGLNKQGWKTERGRVLLKYGMPTNRDMIIASGEERAYEDWFYEDVQGGVHFYFVDLSSIGNYILVHSTAAGEPYYTDWYNTYVIKSRNSQGDQDFWDNNNKLNPLNR